MLCTNSHNNPVDALSCRVCGVDTFQAPTLVQAAPLNSFAVASMVLGIVWLYWLGSVLAVIFSFIALSQIRRRAERGRGFAIAGLVLGLVGVLTLAVTVTLFAVVAHHVHSPG